MRPDRILTEKSPDVQRGQRWTSRAESNPANPLHRITLASVAATLARVGISPAALVLGNPGAAGA